MDETTFSDVLYEDFLRRLAGDRSFQRGLQYFEQGQVRSLAQYDNEISATVQGQYEYTVQLRLQGGKLDYRCSCPVGMRGEFCKHGVATALAWIDEPPVESQSGGTTRRHTGPSMSDLRQYLMELSREDLVETILEQAMGDDRWRDRLLMQVSVNQPMPDIRAVQSKLSEAIALDGDESYGYDDYGRYGASPEYFEKIDEALDGVDALVKAGHGALALEALSDVPMMMEENFEHLGECEADWSATVQRIEQLHARACAIDPPDPLELAQWLFLAEWKSEYGFFQRAAIAYSEFLGEPGQAAYRQWVDKKLEEYGPPPSPPTDGRPMYIRGYYGRSQLLEMRESLMEATGDIEALAALIQEDLSLPDRYLSLVDLYRENGLEDSALEWAVKALQAFPKSTFPSLDDLATFAIEAYWNQKRWDEAIAIAWDDFCRAPGLQDYQRLLRLAEPLQAVDLWRSRGVSYIQELTAEKTASSTYGGGFLSEVRLLIRVLLWEGENEEAWEAAHRYKLDNLNIRNSELWMELLDIRGKTHPKEALKVYRAQVEPAIQTTCNEGYERAVRMLKLMKPLMEELGQAKEFKQWVYKLWTTYKRKRNFSKLLKEEKLISQR